MYHEAIKDCQKAIGLDHRNVKGYWRMGMAYKLLGNKQEAVKVPLY
jgi:tetratricopeptide (TPR) repeat protein